MPTPVHVPCPLCGRDLPKQLMRIEAPFMRIVSCRSCRMMYQSPQMPETEFPDAHLHFGEYAQYPDLNKAKVHLFKDRVDRMVREGELPQKGSFLDVGTGYGAMLDTVADRLPSWSRMAIEISPSAREELRSRNHASVADLSELPEEARFDWINLDNVLEHLPDPLATLKGLRSRLNTDGFLYVEVPNESLIHLKYRVNDWARGFPKPPTFPGHMSLFTRRTLKAMGAASGFKRIRIWSESISDPWRIQALAGMEPTPKLKAIFHALRLTRLDLLAGQGYFLCARFGG